MVSRYRDIIENNQPQMQQVETPTSAHKFSIGSGSSGRGGSVKTPQNDSSSLHTNGNSLFLFLISRNEAIRNIDFF